MAGVWKRVAGGSRCLIQVQVGSLHISKECELGACVWEMGADVGELMELL